MAPKKVILLLTCLLAGRAAAARITTPKTRQAEIAGLYTFGAPGVAVGGAKNARTSSGCFPGYRTWTLRRDSALRSTLDIVVPIARKVNYLHPLVAGVQLEIERETGTTYECSDGLLDFPRSPFLSWTIHDADVYTEYASTIFNDHFGDLAYMTTKAAKELDPVPVAEDAKARGWRLVAHAFDEGKNIIGGPQASHMLQNPETFECMITFRGSYSTQDFFADFDARRSDFCGFDNKWHRGFRDHFRLIVKSDGWQQSIRPALPKCSRVYSTGHSLGGAKATLFAACVQNAPASGTPGYASDFEFISWVPGRPGLLPEYKP